MHFIPFSLTLVL